MPETRRYSFFWRPIILWTIYLRNDR
jgi:hypothetical protein